MIIYFLSVLVIIFFVTFLIIEQNKHHANLSKFPHRIHVNGIRGKSTVTRLIAGILREAGYKTLAKTTGSAARIIDEDGEDRIITRKGKPDVYEQVQIIQEHTPHKFEALVMECMAVNPLYQDFLEKKVMKSTIGIITNVREDHMDEMGGSLKNIAHSLSHTVPFEGLVIVGEKDRSLKQVIQEVAKKRNTQVFDIDNIDVSDEIVNQFSYFQHKDNVALGFAFADSFGISREVALKGMLEAKPDVGAFKILDIKVNKTTIKWANLFAINDRESFVETVALVQKLPELKNLKTAVILNNRLDRAYRVEQFANICTGEISCDYVITFGDYEKEVEKIIINSQKPVQVIKMGNSTSFSNSTGQEILNTIVNNLSEKEILLIGAVNIHTKQADSMLDFLNKS